MTEQDLKHGVVSKGKIRRKIRRAIRPIGKSVVPFNWQPLVLPELTIKNQFQSSSCGGQAASYWLELVDRKLGGLLPNNVFSAKSIYAPAHASGGGMTVYALEQQVAKLGANFEIDVPSYKADGTTDEAWMTDTSYQTPQIAILALRDAYRMATTIPIDIESIACAIRDSGGAVMEIVGVNNGTWLSSQPQPPTSNENTWAHYMCNAVAGTLNGVKVIACPQSWGNTVGQNGWQFFTEDYINSGYIVDCFTWYPNAVMGSGGNTGWVYSFFESMLHKLLG